MREKLLVSLALCLSLGSCAEPKAPASAPPQRLTSAPEPLADDAWGRFHSKRHGLSIPFPDGTRWRIDDRSASWLEAKHASTSSVFRLKAWRAERNVSPAECERELRRAHAWVPSFEGGELIDERALPITPEVGYHTRMRTALLAKPLSDADLSGAVAAFGAHGTKCFAAVFSASARGPQGAQDLGVRLELGARLIEGIEERSALIPAQPWQAPVIERSR